MQVMPAAPDRGPRLRRTLERLAAQARDAWTGRRHRRLFKDGARLWRRIGQDKPAVLEALYERFPRMPRSYVDAYLESLIRDHAGNPRAPLYLDAELGARERQRQLVAELEEHEGSLRGRRVLDIGCSNGSLLLAARDAGALPLVGVDISAERLASARLLCAGSGIDLRVLDFVTEGLPDGLGPFDVIFCTDVLEHVASVTQAAAALKRALAPGPGSFAYVSLFNGRHPSCVRAEPHYGVPGLVLLDPKDAREVWYSVRGSLQSTLDYEVGEWPDFGSLKSLAAGLSLRLELFEDRRAILRTRASFWGGYTRRLEELQAAVRREVAALALSPLHRALILDQLEDYGRTFRAAHQAFAAAQPGLPEEDVLNFYGTYYAQPLRFLLRHA
jgi:2-polyprenyl-3-methyl-5-hydroxy-6-metoxy-1,4-benzoquinol methylase